MVIPYMLLVRVDTVIAKTGGVVLMNDQQIDLPSCRLITGEWYHACYSTNSQACYSTSHQTLIFYKVVMTYAVYISE